MTRLVLVLPFAFSTLARAAVIKEYSVPFGSFPNLITAGPDGTMWCTEAGGDWITSFSLDGVLSVSYPTTSSGCTPIGIAADTTLLAYTCTGLDKIGFVVPGAVGYDAPVTPRPAGPLVLDGEGYLWYTSGDAVVRWNGSSTPLHTGVAGASLFGLGYDRGLIYAADQAHDRVEVFNTVNPAYGGHIDTTGPPYLVAICSGKLWFTVPSQNFIEDSSGSGHPLEIGGHVEGIACAPDGTLWYTDPGTNSIGHFHPSTSAFETYPVPTPNATPYGIAVGPDGSVWFTENAAGKVGRLWLHPPGDVNGDGSVSVTDVFYLINFLFAGGAAPPP